MVNYGTTQPEQANIQSRKQPNTQGSTKLVMIAVVIALCVTVLNFMYIQSQKNNSLQSSIIFYRFKHSMKAGSTIDRDDLEISHISEIYRNSIPEAYIDDYGKEDSLELITNQPLTQDVRENSIVFFDHFTETNYDRIDKKIRSGYRLIALPVNYKTLPGILRPGMFVDIEAPFMVPGHSMAQVMPVMEYVKVVAVGKNSISDEAIASHKLPRIGNFSTISIEVTPEQATQLSSIQKLTVGDFEIHLRPPADSDRPKINDSGINPNVMNLIGRTIQSGR
ncbi:hypothetical protein JD969_01040 [Planctomycetota bacterium]|nr:hypothetical protein JD969_01040 [Planctomycetota bacterium]